MQMFKDFNNHYSESGTGEYSGAVSLQPPVYDNPTERVPGLFANLEGDGKVQIDSIPRLPLELIGQKYAIESQEPHFSHQAFFDRYFIPPEQPGACVGAEDGVSMEQYIDEMWEVLSDYHPHDSYTRIGLRNPAIAPGQRFGEPYYADLWPTALGLAAVGRNREIENNIDNCAQQIDRFGYVPNGARFYYEGRSQLPVFSKLVMLQAVRNKHRARETGNNPEEAEKETLRHYLPQMIREYEFWMKGAEDLAREDKLQASQRVVRMPDGTLLNRYYDANSTPRPESYRKDMHTAIEAGIENPCRPNEFYRHVRGAAESGQDFTVRWFADGKTMKTIETTNIVPVDLNSVMYDMEMTIYRAFKLDGKQESQELARQWKALAEQRAAAVNRYMYDESKGYYFDYHWANGERTPCWTMAGAYPLQSGMSDRRQAKKVLQNLQSRFLQPGGFAASLHDSPEQWDGVNGWAPLQVAGILAACNYGDNELALEASRRWEDRNRELFELTRQMHEKPSVGDRAVPGGGGEYERQVGFGMTNGSVLFAQHVGRLLMPSAVKKPAEAAVAGRILVAA